MVSWHLTTISRADIEPILKIEQRSFRSPWGRISFESELSCQNACHYAVRSDEQMSGRQVIAYIFLRLIDDELHILKMAVTPKWRRLGIATWLLNQCVIMGAQRNAESIYLEVRPSNTPAIELYQKLGFTEIGRRPNYYPNSLEDALIMMKKLKITR